MTDVGGKRVLVVGLARSGRAVAGCLSRRGALVTVTDSRPPAAFQAAIPELMAHKIGLELGSHREETFLRQDLIVVSPGVPSDLPPLEAARRRKIPIVPEIEVASWFLEGRLVGITGTNGKTTTTVLLGKMLESSGLSAVVGGNIGLPLSAVVDRATPDSIVAGELSSFQLEIIQGFRPHVALLLNLTPNHLDRHPSFDAYVRAKAQIFRNQTAEDYAILNADDPNVMSLAPALASQKMFFSRTQDLPEGVFVSNGHIRYRVRNLERALISTDDVRLRGAFNVENVLAAAAAACVLGADFLALRRAVQEFQGVEHRLEYVREIQGVEFYNDSKATSVDATAKALSAFERGVHLILGGKDKGAPYAPLRPLLERRVRSVLLIGASADRMARELSAAAELVRAGDLETAVREAFKRASPGEVVLLAPAGASFDQFEDFEHRGRVFKELTERLAARVEIQDAERRAKEKPPERVSTSSVAVDLPECELKPAAKPTPSCSGVFTSPPGGEVEREAGAAAASLPATPAESTPSPVPADSEAVAPGPWAGEPAVGEGMGSGTLPEEPSVIPSPVGVSGVPAPSREAKGALEVGGKVEQAAPAPKPLELVYVYEVEAEEISALEFETPVQGLESESEPIVIQELRLPESVEDELLPFEVRAAAGEPSGRTPEPGGSASPTPPEAGPAGGNGRDGEASGAGRASARGKRGGQERLPGM